jgi:hypothetical protein
MENNEDFIVNPGDSASNKGSNDLEDCLHEIQELERVKTKDKEKTPIPQSILFTLFGIISCFLSYIETSLLSNLFNSYTNKNIDKSKMFLEDIKYILLFIISLIVIRLKLKKPQIYQVILPFLYSFISYSSTYLYSRNGQSFIILSKVFCLIIVSFFFCINNILKIKESQIYVLPTKVYLGLLLTIIGIVIELVYTYFHTSIEGEDNIRFIFHYNDFRNYAISLSSGICYGVIIILFDVYCKSLENIFDTLFYIGLFSSIICFIISALYSEIPKITSTFSGFGGVQVNYYIVVIALYVFNIILQAILIKKCSMYSVAILISSQISIRIIVDMIKYRGSISNIFTIISLMLYFVGLFFICLHYITNIFNEKKKQNKITSFGSNEHKNYLVNPA